MNPALILTSMARVPIWAWALALLLAWGSWHSYRSKSVRADFEKAKITAQVERAESERAAAVQRARIAVVQQEITDAEITRRKAVEAVAARLRAADERLRDQSAAAAASRSQGSQSAPGGAAAGADPGVLADVFGECRTRIRVLVQEADSTRAAGAACERSYDALKGSP